jgi:hypothetical protein
MFISLLSHPHVSQLDEIIGFWRAGPEFDFFLKVKWKSFPEQVQRERKPSHSSTITTHYFSGVTEEGRIRGFIYISFTHVVKSLITIFNHPW